MWSARSRVVLMAVAVCVATPAPPLAALQAVRYQPTEVADGVYLFTPNDPGFGNVVAIVSSGEALVVDATATPATATGVLESLVALGVERVAVLVNTHWHDDHIWGNQVFAEAFPDLLIVAHPDTVAGIRDLAIPGLSSQLERLRARILERDQQLETGLATDGTALADDDRARIEQRQALFRDAVASMETITPVLPDAVDSGSVSFPIGDIDVRVEHIGAGHTSGDLIVRIPARGVVVAGDLVTQPVPAAAEGDLRIWATTLRALETLEWSVLLPGHGEAQHDRTYTSSLRSLFLGVLQYVNDGVVAGTGVEELVNAADFTDFQDRWLGEDARQKAMFQAFFLEPAIRNVYAAATDGL